MREILLYFALKHNGDWKKIYDSLEKKEVVEIDAVKELENYSESGYITILDKEYPARLKNIHQPPFVLFYKGDVSVLNYKKALAVIGARKCSNYAITKTKKIISELRDCTIISGMAKGIDGCSHSAALSKGEKTIAVLGSGVNCIYPKENSLLYEKIVENGVVVSEYPGNTEPSKESFKIRNRIVAGMSDAVFVVEAGLRSGTMNTVSHALSQGKDIFALPSIFSDKLGTNELIKQGAKLVDTAQDIVSEI